MDAVQSTDSPTVHRLHRVHFILLQLLLVPPINNHLFDAHLHQYKVRKNGVRQKKALADTKAFTVGYQILD